MNIRTDIAQQTRRRDESVPAILDKSAHLETRADVKVSRLKDVDPQSVIVRITTLLVAALLLAACGGSTPPAIQPNGTPTLETPPSATTVAAAPSITTAPTRAAPSITPLPFNSRLALFDYDKKISLDLQEKSVETRDGVLVHDISFAGSGNRRVLAYLIIPAGKGPFAGIVWFHWLGVPNGNRNEFLDEALAYAKNNVASLLIDGYFPWQKPPADLDTDRRMLIEQTTDLRRAFDLFLGRTDVDAKRIAYVGHDFGAMYGAILAGIDKRAQAYVLEAGTTTFTEWFLTYWNPAPPEKRSDYEQAISAFDPIAYISHASPAALFFQFSISDRFVPKTAAEQFYNAASDPKKIEWYPVTHQMQSDDVTKERQEWLAGYLK